MSKIADFMKGVVPYLKSLNWTKEDVKKVLMFIVMLLIACFILNNFLHIKTRIVQTQDDGSIDVNVDGSVNASVDGSVDIPSMIDVRTY
jgi:hypothetical protein